MPDGPDQVSDQAGRGRAAGTSTGKRCAPTQSPTMTSWHSKRLRAQRSTVASGTAL